MHLVMAACPCGCNGCVTWGQAGDWDGRRVVPLSNDRGGIFLGRGIVDDVVINGLFGIIDGGHSVVDCLVEAAPWGGVASSLHKVVKALDDNGQNKNKCKMQGGVKKIYTLKEF